MKTKLLILLIALVAFAVQSYGQLTADAGPDTTTCICSDTLKLGGKPSAKGGEEPYSYKWELLPIFDSDYRVRASEVLNDTTIANPHTDCRIVNDTATFVLTVTDSNGNSTKDSVDVVLSSINVQTALYQVRFLDLGDSARIGPGNIVHGVPPFSYQWTPETGLSNPEIAGPIARPDTTTIFYCTVTDAIGCSTTDFVHVFVEPTGAAKIRNETNTSVVYPNPLQNHSVIRFNASAGKDLFIEVINSKGQIVVEEAVNSGTFEIGKRIQKSGLYFYRIKEQSKIVNTGQFIKN